ncbi:MAG: capsule assembly Wzi family protein [Terriglobus sp.]
MDDDQTGSAFVPMDSWVYPTLERLSTMGLIPSQSMSIRPWTRQECRRQLREAEDILHGFAGMDYEISSATRNEAERLLPDLEHELREPDGRATAVLDETYARIGTIAGPALTDGYHFGQTWWNDYGRPLGRGTSAIAGYRLRIQSGRFFFANRQEFQRDPGLPAVTQAQADLFNKLDNNAFIIPFIDPNIPAGALITPQAAQTAYQRTRPLELYAGVAFAGTALSFGKQEIYWGPTTMGPWAFSRNAEPTYNVRWVATRPHPFPLIPSVGSYRFDFVFGKLSGHKHPARPYFNGAKIELNFGNTLELGFTRWSILFGQGHPMTLRNLKNNLFSSYSPNEYRDGNTNKGFLLGNAVGRDGRAFEGRLGYWISARTRVEGGYRQSKLSQKFLTGGGTISDGFVEANYNRGEWTIGVFAQGERFLIPTYMSGSQSNGSARLQITWTPHKSEALQP